MVILLTECDAEIDNWLDRELISRLNLVLSLDEEYEKEERPANGGMDSKLAVILLAVIDMDVDESTVA
jgi:hypothetical protein